MESLLLLPLWLQLEVQMTNQASGKAVTHRIRREEGRKGKKKRICQWICFFWEVKAPIHTFSPRWYQPTLACMSIKKEAPPQSGEHETLDLGIVSSSPTLGLDIT